MPTCSKSLVIFTLFAVLWLENKTHHCGFPHEKTHKKFEKGKTSTKTSTAAPTPAKQIKVNYKCNTRTKPSCKCGKDYDSYYYPCQKVEIAMTCLSVCRQYQQTTTFAKKIAQKCRELYAGSIIGATILPLVRSERHLRHQTNLWSVRIQASPSASVTMMPIIIRYQKVEIALTWKQQCQQLKQCSTTDARNSFATKRKLSAETLVVATTTMSIQPNVIPKLVIM